MQWLAAALLAVYFLFFLNRIGTDALLTKIASLNAFDWLAIAFLPVLVFAIWLFARAKSAGNLRPGQLAIVITTALTLTLLIYAPQFHDPAFNVLLAAYFATVGWIYTNYNNTLQQRKNFRSTG